LRRRLRDTAACAAGVAPRRVLITGISGMIGSHLARVLVAADCTKVFGLVRPRSDLAALHGILRRIELVQGDIADAVNIRRVVDRIQPHFIYHMAAQAINGISHGIPDLTLDVNIRGTLNLLEPVRDSVQTWARERGVPCRVLLAGSSTEYGRTADVSNGAALKEDAVLSPVTPYGVSKLASENLANLYHTAYNVSVLTARFFIQVGVGGTDSLAIHEFCKQIALAEQGLGPAVVLHGNLETSRDMTDASDSAPVVVALAERGRVGEAYNLGSGRTMTVLDLLHTAIRLAKVNVEARVDPSRFRAYDEKVLLADNAKVRALTGWVPATNMTTSVQRILDYWRRKVATLYGADSSPLVAESTVQSARLAAALEGGGASGSLFHALRTRAYVGQRLFDSGIPPSGEKPLRAAHAVAVDVPSTRHCANWAVCTTINRPSDAVRAVAQLPGWCLVVVGDQKTPTSYSLPHTESSVIESATPESAEVQQAVGIGSTKRRDKKVVLYLSPADQVALGYRVLEHLPWNHFGRKNVGYLFAIAHGAQRVFDFDDDNLLLCVGQHAIPMLHASATIDEVDTTQPVYNLYQQMVSTNTTAWPRGFPLDKVRSTSTNSAMWRRGVHRRIGVVQSLADVEPDVDAIYRLTGGALPFYFHGPRSPLRRVEEPSTAAGGSSPQVETASHASEGETPALRAAVSTPPSLEQLRSCKQDGGSMQAADTAKPAVRGERSSPGFMAGLGHESGCLQGR